MAAPRPQANDICDYSQNVGLVFRTYGSSIWLCRLALPPLPKYLRIIEAMTLRWLFFRVTACLVASRSASTTCLLEAIPEVERSHINTRDGKDIPIGFFQGAWESAYLTSDIARILVEEVLGYHTWIHPEDGRSAVTTPYAPAGCLDFNNATNQQCGINETRLHVCVDCRSASYASVVEDMKDTFPH